MNAPFTPGLTNTPLKTAVILLFRSAPPFVLYPDNPETIFEEFKTVLRNKAANAPKLIEKTASGPIKKLVFVDTELIGVSLQQGAMPVGMAG